nr:MAG TPA: hypothetical protein [Caudoviricetes sp.]
MRTTRRPSAFSRKTRKSDKTKKNEHGAKPPKTNSVL